MEDANMVISASGKQVKKGDVQHDRAPEIRFDEIEIQKKIGKGCFGSVFEGRCRGIPVAIKQLHKQNLDPKTMEEFRREVDILTQMRHPNVVLFLGACTEPGKMTIVCELLKDNVQNLLRTQKNMPLLKRLRIAKGTAAGMAWLHGAHPQILHRDLKPANLLLDEHWNVKVCDFGLSQVKIEGSAIRDGKSIPGTPLWMAPEVLLGEDVSDKADVYSFGVVLWEIITGEELFPEMDSFGTFKRAITKEGLRPTIPASCNPSLAALMRKCWDKDPAARPSFIQIIHILDGVFVDCLISDPVGNRFWKEHFLGTEYAHWGDFVNHFSALLGLPKPNPKDLNFACLKRLAAEPNTEPNSKDSEILTLEKFSHLLNWFGPLELSSGFSILDQIRVIMKQDWFHGDITKETSEELLAGQEPGTFLVRLSTTEPDKPFTISKVTQAGKINHQRLTKKDGLLQLKIVYPDNTTRIATCQSNSKDNNIKHFIENLEKDLSLNTPCPGSKYKTLFISNFDKVVRGYLADNGEE